MGRDDGEEADELDGEEINECDKDEMNERDEEKTDELDGEEADELMMVTRHGERPLLIHKPREGTRTWISQ